jgi:putative endopeptidase
MRPTTFPTLPGMNINGRVAMGENIGDLGGILLGLEAYRNFARRQAGAGDRRLHRRAAPVHGLGAGLADAVARRCARQQIVNGPHSPGQIRAFAPLRNVDAWYEAFNVKPGDKLYIPPEQRVRIW